MIIDRRFSPDTEVFYVGNGVLVKSRVEKIVISSIGGDIQINYIAYNNREPLLAEDCFLSKGDLIKHLEESEVQNNCGPF